MLDLLKKLALAYSPSGMENEVRDIIISNLDIDKNDFVVDKLGNLIVTHKGINSERKISFFTAMDEACIMARKITKEGFIKFNTIGTQQENLPAKSFHCGANGVYGVVGGRTWHLSSSTEKTSQPDSKDLIMDIGANSEDDALNHISIGDLFVYNSEFCENCDESYSSKAMERSSCCLTLLNALNSDIKQRFYGVFTSCHKASSAGITIGANILSPYYGIILESISCGDIPLCSEEKACSTGNGFVISYSDQRTFYDKKLTSHIIELAKENNIKHQIKSKAIVCDDAKALLSNGNGVKTCLIGLPCEYPNSPCTTVKKDDIIQCQKIIEAIACENLNI